MKNVNMKWIVVLGVLPLVLLGLSIYYSNLYNNYDYVLTAGHTGFPLSSSEESQLAFYSFTSENDTHDITFVLFTNIPDIFPQGDKEADRDSERTNYGSENKVGVMVGGTNRHYRGYSGYIEYRENCEDVCEQVLTGEIGEDSVNLNGEKYDLDEGQVFVAIRQGDEIEIEQISAAETPDEYFVVAGEYRQQKIEELSRTLNITDVLSE